MLEEDEVEASEELCRGCEVSLLGGTVEGAGGNLELDEPFDGLNSGWEA
jgi:hypothetical protein